jgi:type III secretion protein R
LFSTGYAQEVSAATTNPNLISKLSLLAGLALLPFCIMLMTSFVKMIVVLSLLRNALGIQQTPPNQVLNGIALLLTVYVMFPTGLAMYDASKELLPKAPKEAFSDESAAFIVELIDKSKEPMRQFLIRNTISKHQTSFYQLAFRVFPDPYKAQLKTTDSAY